MNLRSILVALALFLTLAGVSRAQPLVNPYPFAMPDSLDVDTSLVIGTWERAGERGRIVARDGHFYDPDGQRFQIVGTTMRLYGCFPDSAAAIRIARRLRALGINTVQFMQFDYTYYQPYSILAAGETSTGNGLDPTYAQRFDWFTHQLREHGIYYGFVMHSIWRPRPGDGVRQPDSTGWGTRTPIFFDPVVQRIHRDILRLLLEHVNPYNGVAYKDDPALLYLMPIEDPSLDVYWMYTKDVVRSNPSGTAVVGLEHLALIDSLFQEFLIAKGYTVDAQLENAWKSWATDPSEQMRNGGFEDPFDQSFWAFRTNAALGAQAILQYSDVEKVSGSYSGKVLIGNPSSSIAGVYLTAALSKTLNKHMYRLSMKLKTTPQQKKRRIQVYLYAGAYPYEGLLNQTFEIMDQWQEYAWDFVAKSSSEDAPIIQIRCGLDPGDVYLDDVSFKEVNISGLRPGESIKNRTVQRLPFWDGAISTKRIEHQAAFYQQHQEQVFEDVRKLIRDTLQSQVLLSPGRRVYSARDRYAARNYDFFSYYDFRSSAISQLEETGGGSLWVHSAQNLSNKPYVLSGLGYYFPRPYQSEVALAIPAYAGMHDWDGVHFSYFTYTPLAGRERSDSGDVWEIYNKPHVLTLLPAASNMMRRRDLDTTEKTLVIANDQEAITYPQFHSNQAYSLSLGGDGRMGHYRRIVMNPELQEQESFLPQLDIPPLTGTVDPTTFDSENGQILLDATRAVMRVQTPYTLAVAGRLEGQILTEQNMILEQTSAGEHTTVILTSLTDSAVVRSERNLLVVGSRGLNEGAEFNAENTALTMWGKGPMMLEGRSIRLTIKAETWDSCHLTPLGADARPILSKRRSIERSPTGRFSLAVETNVDQSPWYLVEFSNIPTSVAEGGLPPAIRAVPNPVTDGRLSVHHADAAHRVDVVDLTGAVVRTQAASGSLTSLNVNGLAAGVYTVLVDGGHRGITSVVIHD